MDNKKNEELIIARFWLEAVDLELAHLWGNDFEVFKDHLYGRFENLTRYAQYIIEEWDRSNFIQFQLSGRIKPSDVLNDEYYMSEVYPFKYPNPEDPDDDTVYVFHTQGYFDRMDG